MMFFMRSVSDESIFPSTFASANGADSLSHSVSPSIIDCTMARSLESMVSSLLAFP